MKQYTKKEIDQLVEIRRRLKSELGAAIQLADPDLLNVLIDYWPRSRDAITRSRIREFMDDVGGEWRERLDRVRAAEERKTGKRSLLS